ARLGRYRAKGAKPAAVPPDRSKDRSFVMWTLSGFADEISADLQTQCETLNALGIGSIELRSAWGTNVLDLDDGRLEAARTILASHHIQMSSVGSPIGKIS